MTDLDQTCVSLFLFRCVCLCACCAANDACRAGLQACRPLAAGCSPCLLSCHPCSGAHIDLWRVAEGNSTACIAFKHLCICCSCPLPCSGAHDDLWKEAEGTLVALFSPKASRSPNISSIHNGMPCSHAWRMSNACIVLWCCCPEGRVPARGPHLPRALARCACIQRELTDCTALVLHLPRFQRFHISFRCRRFAQRATFR